MIKLPERKPLDKLLEIAQKITNPEKRREERESDKQKYGQTTGEKKGS